MPFAKYWTRRTPVEKRTSGIRLDYRSVNLRRAAYRPDPHWPLRWTALALGCIVLGVVMAKSQDPAAGSTADLSGAARERMVEEELAVPDVPEDAPPAVPASKPAVAYWNTRTVDDGDTFGRLLRDSGIGSETIHALASAGEAGRAMARIYPGDELRLGFDRADRLVRLRYQPEPDRELRFERTDGGFDGREIAHPLQKRFEHARGVIRTSLFEAGADAGLSDRLIMQMVGIFGWDIDFVLDIRRGDRFSLIYETFYKHGDRVRTGNIVAAEFINGGRAYRAVRYTDPEGSTAYFSPDGQSMRKAFLRTPVKFTRISSGFGQRYHPSLHRMRDHHGVDYAARRGTPVRATGDGRIDYRGYNGGYGRMIVIRHGRRYSTAYAHMSSYGRNTAPGRRVEQGDVIGYVGSSGRSTGPHLHYEFRVNGEHRDPLKVEFPSVAPVAPEYRDDFRASIGPLVHKLETLKRAYAERGD